MKIMNKGFLLVFGIFCATASPASGQVLRDIYEYDKPGFWDKKYNIRPDYVASYHVEISTTLAAEHYAWNYLSQAGAKPIGGNFADWALPEERAPDLLQFIMGLGRLRVYYRNNQEPVPVSEIAELEYKFGELKKERETIAVNARTIPGILGLLDAELKSLEAKLNSYRSGKGIVEVSISVDYEKKK